MSAPVVKLQKLVAKQSSTRGKVPSEEREFWVSMRQSLLMQLSTIEKKLGIQRRCKNCGHAQ